MLRKILNTIEEKYVFNISQYFWHIFISLASLALVGGILLLLWGIIPPGKDNVVKAEYPPVVQVSADEVIASLTKQEKGIDTPVNKSEFKQVVQEVTYSDPEESSYNISLDSLKKLIPPDKYSWSSSGYYYYPYGERYYSRYKNTRYGNQYRQWIVKETGILEKLNDAYKKSNASNFKEKKLILNSYIELVKRFDEGKRAFVLKKITEYPGSGPSETVENIKVLNGSVDIFGIGSTDYLTTLVKFGSRNPTEGRTLILYANKVLVKFLSEYRSDVLSTILSSFYSYFNNKVNQQIEITDLFLKDVQKYEPAKYTKALELYYYLMVDRNRQRERKIEDIERDYTLALARANSEYELAKVEKAGIRLNGIYIGAGAISVIAVLALILVLLSIQRYVKKINQNLSTQNQD